MTTKTIQALLVLMVAGLVGTSSFNAVYSAQDESVPTTESLDQKCLNAILNQSNSPKSKEMGISAVNIARNSIALENVVKSGNFEIYEGTQIYDFNPETCQNELIITNVEVVDFDEDGNKRHTTMEVDAKTNEVKNLITELDKDIPRHSGVIQSLAHAGYAFSANSAATNEVHQAAMNYAVPTPNDPSQFNCGTTSSTKCYASIWTGLTTETDETPMAQAGTDSICSGSDCASGRTYTGWIEKVSSSGTSTPYSCGSTFNSYLSSADSMMTQITNGELSGGTNTDNIGYVVNISDNKTCTTTLTSSVSNPTYSLYQYERPSFSDVPAPLAQITDVSNVYSTMYYDSANRVISTPYSNGWYQNYEMWTALPPSGTQNADGVKLTGSYLKFDWITSSGTN